MRDSPQAEYADPLDPGTRPYVSIRMNHCGELCLDVRQLPIRSALESIGRLIADNEGTSPQCRDDLDAARHALAKCLGEWINSLKCNTLDQKAKSIDRFEQVRQWLELPRRDGGPSINQQLFVSAILDANGTVSHEDLAEKLKQTKQDACDRNKSMMRRVNQKLEKLGASWELGQNCGKVAILDASKSDPK